MRFAPTQSKPIAVGVRPRVTARLDPSSAAVRPPGSRVVVRGRVRPAKRRALLIVERVGSNGVRHRVARRVVAVRSGRARASVRLARRGSYVVRFAVLPDAKNIGARSKAVAVTIR